MNVYRLETVEGHGPYEGNQECSLCVIPHNDPEEATMLASIRYTRKQFKQIEPEFVFAWKTKRQALRFVKRKSRQRVHDRGFRINKYSVPKQSTLRFFDGQVMFKKSRATLIETIFLK